jgi:hypothetical protein
LEKIYYSPSVIAAKLFRGWLMVFSPWLGIICPYWLVDNREI